MKEVVIRVNAYILYRAQRGPSLDLRCVSWRGGERSRIGQDLEEFLQLIVVDACVNHSVALLLRRAKRVATKKVLTTLETLAEEAFESNVFASFLAPAPSHLAPHFKHGSYYLLLKVPAVAFEALLEGLL